MRKIKYRLKSINKLLRGVIFIIERKHRFKWVKAQLFCQYTYSNVSLAVEAIKELHKNEQVILSIKARWTEEKTNGM